MRSGTLRRARLWCPSLSISPWTLDQQHGPPQYNTTPLFPPFRPVHDQYSSVCLPFAALLSYRLTRSIITPIPCARHLPHSLRYLSLSVLLQELAVSLLRVRMEFPAVWEGFQPYLGSLPGSDDVYTLYNFKEEHITLLQDAEMVGHTC